LCYGLRFARVVIMTWWSGRHASRPHLRRTPPARKGQT
jgi:hypothetical protein